MNLPIGAEKTWDGYIPSRGLFCFACQICKCLMGWYFHGIPTDVANGVIGKWIPGRDILISKLTCDTQLGNNIRELKLYSELSNKTSWKGFVKKDNSEPEFKKPNVDFNLYALGVNCNFEYIL